MADLTALIVDDDENFRASVVELIRREGFATLEAGSLEQARVELGRSPTVVLLDLGLPDGDGLELLGHDDWVQTSEFVVMTGKSGTESVISALRAGALDYLPKPVDRSRLQTILTNVARTRGLKREVTELRSELRGLGRFGPMVGGSKSMQQVYDLISRVAPTESTVFITGESGTGKELAAQSVHRVSGRKDQPFLAVNCGAISPTLIESELFGHEKGSFTGADRRHRGYFEEASGGTLFLDEITEMPIELQVKLLRVLETGTITRLGATSPIEVNVRVVAASNRDPREAVQENDLREDLLYRLNVFPVHMPPLRERGGDIEILAQHFLDEVNAREGTSKRFSGTAKVHLRQLPWPGNVRELKNAVERAAILVDDILEPDVLPALDRTQLAHTDASSTLQVRIGSSIEDAERRLIQATLIELEGDKKRASEVLGISLKTLYNRLNVYEAASGSTKNAPA